MPARWIDRRPRRTEATTADHEERDGCEQPAPIASARVVMHGPLTHLRRQRFRAMRRDRGSRLLALEFAGCCRGREPSRLVGRQEVVYERWARGSANRAQPEFERLYHECYRPSVRLAHLLTGSNAIAEEIVQEAFVRVHERYEALKVPAAYLRTVVTNLSRSHLRRVRRERRLVPERAGVELPPEIDETWKAVVALPFDQRAVLVLRYYADLTEAEVASVLNCRVGTVKSRHHRALTKLRQELS
jgi:RNA polymerase sigma-70 factor (sigma-E family)